MTFHDMAEELESDFEIEDDFECDGHPYQFEPEYTDEILERRRQRQAAEQRAIEQANVFAYVWSLFTLDH